MGEVVTGYEALQITSAGLVQTVDVLKVEGPDAISYLQGQCTQDLGSLEVGRSTRSLLLSATGKIEAYVGLVRSAQDQVLVVVDDGYGPRVRDRLERYRIRVKLEISPDPGWTCFSIRGPQASEALMAMSTRDRPAAMGSTHTVSCWLLDASWQGWPGVDLLLRGSDGVPGAAGSAPGPVDPDELRSMAPGARVDIGPLAGVVICSKGEWEAARIEAGIPAMGKELDQTTIPAEVPGLLEAAVSFTKGCYTGQELVARLDARGNKVARHLRGLVALNQKAPIVDPGDLSMLSGTTIFSEAGKALGSVTSASYSPRRRALIALGYLHRSVTAGDKVFAQMGYSSNVPNDPPSDDPSATQADLSSRVGEPGWSATDMLELVVLELGEGGSSGISSPAAARNQTTTQVPPVGPRGE